LIRGKKKKKKKKKGRKKRKRKKKIRKIPGFNHVVIGVFMEPNKVIHRIFLDIDPA